MRSLFILALAWYCMPAIAQDTWELVKANASVKVYTKYEAGNSYKSVKAVGFVKSTSEELLKVLDDVGGYKHWFAYSKSVRLLKKEKNKKYLYMESSFPWPFSNEDMIYILSVRKHKNGKIKCFFDGSPESTPAVKGIKRMLDAKGYILLHSEKEHTKITFVMYTALSGSIPLWMANKYIHLLPFETINNLIMTVKKCGANSNEICGDNAYDTI